MTTLTQEQRERLHETLRTMIVGVSMNDLRALLADSDAQAAQEGGEG